MSEAGAVSAGKPSVKRAENLNLRVQEIAVTILQSHGLELIEAVCAGQGPRTVIRVFIDKPGGITLTDCEQAHRSPSRPFEPTFSSTIRTESSSKALLWDATGIPSRFSSGINSRFSIPSCFANSYTRIQYRFAPPA